MDRLPKTVQVRVSPGKVEELPVMRWVDHPGRALVYAGEERRPLLVEREGESDLYLPASPSPRPERKLWSGWQHVALSAACGLGLWVVLHYFSATAPGVRREPAPPAATVTPPVTVTQPSLPARPVRKRAAPVPAKPPPPSAPIARRPLAPKRAKAATPAAAPVQRRSAPATEQSRKPMHAAAPRPPLGTLRQVVQRQTQEPAYECECGQRFKTEQELAAHRSRVVYSCIRYPACTFTAKTPEGVRAHYEAQREERGPCYSEAIRLINRYAVVARPECPAHAADPDRRKTVRVAGLALCSEEEDPHARILERGKEKGER